MKQLVDEDYYDDDDDYYDDNYDDYDDGYSGGSTTLKNKKSTGKPNTTTAQKPSSKQQPGGSKSSASAAATAKKPNAMTAASIAKGKSSGSISGGVRTTSSAAIPPQDISRNSTTIASVTTLLPPPGFQPINTTTFMDVATSAQELGSHDGNSVNTVTDRSSSSTMIASAVTIPQVLLEQMSQQTQIPLTVVVLGHVDAGKSTISGHLLHGSNCSRSLNINKQNQQSRTSNSTTNRNASTNFAWLLDEDEQERVHGVTMDIATKRLTSNKSSKFDIVLQDAPGHADYVPAMITGTASADAALLCVDATDLHTALGNGQLREHAYLARGLGVNQILVVLNKMDVVGWDQEATYLRMESMLMEFLIKQVGYPTGRVRCIPLSGLTGTNIFPIDNVNASDAETKMLRLWYKGPTLIEALDNFQAPASQQQSKLLEKPLRIIVSDVIESSGSISLRAKVVSGWVKQGETLVVLPVGDNAVISKLNSLHVTTSTQESTTTQQQQQLRRQYCAAGELLDCVIAGIDAQRISTGSLLVRNSCRPPLSARCRSKIFVLDNSGNSNSSAIQIPLIRGAQMIFHMHHLDVPCHVSALIRTLKPDGISSLKERPRALTKNCTAIVELQLAIPICMEAFTDCRALGRFVLRRNGESIAVGRVEETLS